MNWEATKVILDGAALLISIGVGIYAYWSNRKSARRAEIEELKASDIDLERKITANAARMDSIDNDMAHSPSHSDINALRQTVSDLSGHVQNLTGSMTVINRFVDMMNDHLMNAAGGRRD